MKILVSNDDGVYATGIRVLADALREFAEVTIVAPDRNRSGASNSLTLAVPLRANEIAPKVWSVEGTPTDCIYLAIAGFLKGLPDIVISGINENPNLGDDVWYSGTVAAAIEGSFFGVPAIAISLERASDQRYETAAWVAVQLIEKLKRDPLPASTILNVNVPDLPTNELLGFEVTRLGTRQRPESIVRRDDPRGHPIYWIGACGSGKDAGPGTDFHAVSAKKVSITPLRVDLTHYKAFEQIAHWVTGLT